MCSYMKKLLYACGIYMVYPMLMSDLLLTQQRWYEMITTLPTTK